MENFRTNSYFKLCWKSFFPTSKQPVANDQFVKSIVATGRRLLKEYRAIRVQLWHTGYTPVILNIEYSADFKSFESKHDKMLKFQGDLITVCQELSAISKKSRHLRKLNHLFEQVDVALKDSDYIARCTEREKEYLRYPFMNERQIFKKDFCHLVDNTPDIFKQFSETKRKIKRN